MAFHFLLHQLMKMTTMLIPLEHPSPVLLHQHALFGGFPSPWLLGTQQYLQHSARQHLTKLAIGKSTRCKPIYILWLSISLCHNKFTHTYLSEEKIYQALHIKHSHKSYTDSIKYAYTKKNKFSKTYQ